MWGFVNSKQLELLNKTQENLEASQKNNELLQEALTQYFNIKVNKVMPKSDEEKLKAAYALNLCTVSISQIIDYNDINFLEKEYDAILNNLNLEEMPKDEALLRILKQLLDVITFFRIQEGEKKILEREYQQKVKNAIWSAIPNPSVIVASGSPIGIAISLASQVGIGYMNYRKEKANISLEKERKDWELQRSAIEQFNGLRRELFDTAWRLADEYNFPDEYRITERQISQFNEILLDSDDLRRYERLDYIKNNFVAYPPFWYYIGNAANAASRNGGEFCEEYKKIAIECFDKFFEKIGSNLLREDQLVASCALEKFDLLGEDATEEKKQLLEKAIKASGNALDVKQICAISYLKIGETEKACNMLRMLVNEDYNTVLNAQLLSRLYATQIKNSDNTKEIERKYRTLAERVNNANLLFPLPDGTSNDTELSFIKSQKEYLKDKYAKILELYIEDCKNQFKEICKLKGNITNRVSALIENIYYSVAELSSSYQNVFIDELKESIGQDCNYANWIKDDNSRKSKEPIEVFNSWFKNSFSEMAEKIVNNVKEIEDMGAVSECESSLNLFSEKNGLEEKIEKFNTDVFKNNNPIDDLFSEKVKKDLGVYKDATEMLKVITDSVSAKGLVRNDDKLKFITKKDSKFESYLKKNEKFINKSDIDKDSIIAVLDDRTKFPNVDLIFTADRIAIINNEWFARKIRYSEEYSKISFDKDEKIKIKNYSYKNDDADMDTLRELIKKIKDAKETKGTKENSVGKEGVEGGSLSEKIYETINNAEI